jgi:hypothetical protein
MFNPLWLLALGNIIPVVPQAPWYNGPFSNKESLPIWHFTFNNDADPQVRASYYDKILRIFFQDQSSSHRTVQTDNFNDATEIQFPKSQSIDYIVYDDQGQSNLSTSYPALIAGSDLDIYSSNDNGIAWKISCNSCATSTVKKGAEVTLSPMKTFWVSINRENQIISSKDLKTWQTHPLDPNVMLNNIFPLNDGTGNYKWILVQKVERHPSNYYGYYLGRFSEERGFEAEYAPNNLTYGVDDVQVAFATNGANIETEKMMIVTSGNTYDSFASFMFATVTPRAPFILNTARRVTLKTINGVPMLVQDPAIEFGTIAGKKYEFANEQVSEEQNELLVNVSTTSFMMLLEFSLGECKEVGVIIRMSEDATERTKIGYMSDEVYYINRFHSSSSHSNTKLYKQRYDARQKPTLPSAILHFLILGDGPLLEVYFDQHQIVFNLLIFAKSTSNKMQLFSSRGDATLTQLKLETYD